MIDHITIKEIEIFDNKKVILAVTIHLKLNGYAPKQTLEYLKNIRYTDEQKKTSKSQNETCLSLGGGEGALPSICTIPLKATQLQVSGRFLNMCRS